MQSFFEAIERRSVRVLAASLAVTAALTLPLIAMQPDATASQSPRGEVFDTQDLVEERFQSAIYTPLYLVESRDGDILQRDPLFELLQNEVRLRESAPGEVLVQQYDPDTQRVRSGLASIADAVDLVLLANWVGGLEHATDDQVKIAVSQLLADESSFSGLRETLSVDRRSERRVVGTQDVEIDYWTASALTIEVLADNDALGGSPVAVEIGSDDTTLEEYAREAQTALRGDEEHFRVWGLAIDVNLTSEEEGTTAGPFIALTIVTVLLVVGLLLRSYWAVASIGAGLGMLIVWLKGVSNLVGLESSLTLDLIVPIAMISFGVDFAFHALGRYRDQRRNGPSGRPAGAFVLGMTGVFGALTLALVSDSVAFLSNVTAGIPSVIQFGIGATIALVAAFLVLGILVPLMIASVEWEQESRAGVSRGAGVRTVGGLLAALFAGAAVLTLIVFPPIGVGVLALYLLLFIGIPLAIIRRSAVTEAPTVELEDPGRSVGDGTVPGFTVRTVIAICQLRRVLLPIVLGLTAFAAVFAIRVEAEFDVKDFFSADTDFVVALDKLDEHIGDRGGEEAIFYIEADLGRPEVLSVIDEQLASLDEARSARLARDDEGALVLSVTPSELSAATLASEAALSRIASDTGIELADADGDGIADSPEQLVALFGAASASGIALDDERLRYSTDQVRQIVWRNEAGTPAAAQVAIQLPGTRAIENITAAKAELDPFVDSFNAALRAVDPGAHVALTGGPFTRQAGLDATYRALQLSLPIAVVLCLLAVALFMRSLRFAAASIVPILVVVTWLYAFMYFAGFTLNLVTATIGAISIGVGIDYSIHYTMRFREELAHHDRLGAVQRAGATTGNALIGSAISSVAGFIVMSFAPMPLFATYGFLTAVMIVLAAAAALVVLPPLLMLITSDPLGEDVEAGAT